MALIQMNYNSKALFRTVPVNVILPADRFDSDTDTYTEDNTEPGLRSSCPPERIRSIWTSW